MTDVTPEQAAAHAFITGCVKRGITAGQAVVPPDDRKLRLVRDLWGEVAQAVIAAHKPRWTEKLGPVVLCEHEQELEPLAAPADTVPSEALDIAWNALQHVALHADDKSAAKAREALRAVSEYLEDGTTEDGIDRTPHTQPVTAVTVDALAAALGRRVILVDVDDAERSDTGDGMWLVRPARPRDLAVQLLSDANPHPELHAVSAGSGEAAENMPGNIPGADGRTAGQVAFEAFYRSFPGWVPIWPPDGHVAAWEAAARAVETQQVRRAREDRDAVRKRMLDLAAEFGDATPDDEIEGYTAGSLYMALRAEVLNAAAAKMRKGLDV